MNKDSHPLSRKALPGLEKRYQSEKRFKQLGIFAVLASLTFLVFLIAVLAYRGVGAFIATDIRLEVTPALIEAHSESDFTLLRQVLRHNLPDAKGRTGRREAYQLAAQSAEVELGVALAKLGVITTPVDVWIPASDIVDFATKEGLETSSVAGLTAQQLMWLRDWQKTGKTRQRFNTGFFTNGDSRDPERAGIASALIGSVYTLGVCLVLSFVIGVMTAIYLEEFAPKNKFTTFLEININNLATVPSIIFGLLGLAVFLNLFGLPRSSALSGGIVLALMTLPTIIITGRVSLQSVPVLIREAALAIGASKIQAVFHHVLPLALPGMLTGTILGMARALGETAPLLMIGMVAFIADPPDSLTDPASVLPVQIFLWANSPERGFAEKTAGAIIILLVFLLLMNLTAIILRKKLEKRW